MVNNIKFKGNKPYQVFEEYDPAKTKEELIRDLKETSSEKQKNFSIEFINNRLIINSRNYKIINWIIYLICCCLVIPGFIHHLTVIYFLLMIFYFLVLAIIFGWIGRFSKRTLINFTKKKILISNNNPFGKYLFKEKSFKFTDVKDICSEEIKIRNSNGGSNLFNRVYIITKSNEKISMIDLGADMFYFVDDKKFILIIRNLIKEK